MPTTSDGQQYDHEWYEIGEPGSVVYKPSTDTTTHFRDQLNDYALALITDVGHRRQYIPNDVIELRRGGWTLHSYVETCNPFINRKENDMFAVGVPCSPPNRRQAARDFQREVEALGYDTYLQLEYAPYQFTSQLAGGHLLIKTMDDAKLPE